jgi:quinolinate synthase
MNIIEKIYKEKIDKNAIILVHFYQRPEIQDIADFTGDSLGLARKALETNADVIVFAGVHFMAETAKILNPLKKVLIPDPEAGCSLADSCPPEDFGRFIEKYSDHMVVSYINCSAEVKAMSDIICTSGNAVKLINSLPSEQKIIFAPDKNLGAYINKVTGRNMVLWNGTCHVHDVIKTEEIIKMKIRHPDAKLIAHPECRAVILEIADFIGSTTSLLNFTKQDDSKKYIVATETGIIHAMKKASPEKEFYIVPQDEKCGCNDCEYMKRNTLQKIYHALKSEQPEILLPEDIMEKARKPIMRMLELSK